MKAKMIALLLTVVLIAGGCVNNLKDKETTTVTFWHVMGGPSGEALDIIADSFNILNPGIRIELISVGTYEALSTKLMASISNPPVMSQVYESWTSEFFSSGILTPVEDLMDSSYKADVLNDVYEVFIKDNTFEGKLVTMPFNKSVPAYFYNADVFEKHGYADFPATWNSFLQAMKKLTVDKNNDGNVDFHGTAFNINVWMFECRLLQYNGALADNSLNPLFNSEAGIKAIEIDRKMVIEDKSGYTTTGYQHQDDFLSQKVGTIYGSCVSLSFIMDANPPFRLKMAPVPTGDKNAVLISGTNVAIFNKATKEEQEAAYKFIQFFTSSEIQALWASKTGYLPVRKSSMESELMKEQFEKHEGLESVYRQLEHAYMEPQDKEWYIGRKLLGNALEYAVKGNKTPKAALDEAAEEFRKELKRNGKI
ncbi:MAG: ABC transporter substrate-binding protein [bacterium]|nr:ABC transporter substrate-binding protein [bacterium]